MLKVNGRTYRAIIVGLSLVALMCFSFSSINAMMRSDSSQVAEREDKKDSAKSLIAGSSDMDEAIAEMINDHSLGNDDAPITILDYSSFTCGHCGNFHMQTLPKIKEKFIDTGKVRFVFRDFPMEGKSAAASMLSRCAPKESYYDVLDVFFGNQSDWMMFADTKEKLSGYVSLLGMTDEDTKACLRNEKLLKALMDMRTEAVETYGIRATPTFIVQKGMRQEKIEGAVPLSKFEEIIKKLNAG
ncbi:MAG: DsbA family protein [Alphaproteobacteria bacterium]|nr:DsbA family protein [Alphaproteobacteria bacterium]